MAIDLAIDPQSPHPPFEQLRRQLIERIMTRALPAGTRLPAVRALAAELGLAANTVARAYKELESEGYLITRGRAGTSVAPIAPPGADAVREAEAETAAYVRRMRSLGLAPDGVLAAVRRALDRE